MSSAPSTPKAVVPGVRLESCERIARLAASFAILTGLCVLTGWTFHLLPLMTVLPGYVAMKPNTALGFLWSGSSLLLFLRPATARWAVKLSAGIAGAVTVLGVLISAQYLSGINLGIDELLFNDYVQNVPGYNPGRMSPITAINFSLVGFALLSLHFRWKGPCCQALSMVVALTSLFALLGNFFGVRTLFQSGHFTAVALHTAIAFVALAVGLWCATSREGVMKLATGPGASGMLLRRYGMAAIILPFLFAWVLLQGEHTGWYGIELGAALFAVANAATFSLLIWIGARSLRHSEKREARARAELLEAHSELEARVGLRTTELAAANAGLEQQIRERSQAERANAQILDHSLDVICTLDAAGRFLLVSRACEEVWGYRPEELLGRLFLDFVHPDDQPTTAGNDAAVLEGGHVNDFANRYVRKDGTVVLMRWSANWSESEQTTFCVARDMTLRMQAEDELLRAKEAAEASNRAKSEFLANMSHEIRTPMNGILGMTELVLDSPLDRQQREFLGMAQSSANSLLALINNILDFSKIEAGKLELESIPFSLRDSIHHLLKPIALRSQQKGLDLIVEIAGDVPEYLIGDPLRLRQILLNFTDNALKFTHRGSVSVKVSVESFAEGESCLHFAISDTGIGIPPDKQAVIFEAFAQVDGSTTRQYGGSGLGLAIVSQLVTQMRGKVSIASIVEEGTTFHFTAWFKLGSAPLRSADEPAPSREEILPPISGLRILLAEDNAINRAVATAMLEKRGHSLVQAANGLEALAAAGREPFDVIFMDVQMPEMDGFEATRCIREMEKLPGRHSTIVAMTAHAMAGDRERCLAAGMDDYISKPLNRTKLLAVLKRLQPPAPSASSN